MQSFLHRALWVRVCGQWEGVFMFRLGPFFSKAFKRFQKPFWFVHCESAVLSGVGSSCFVFELDGKQLMLVKWVEERLDATLGILEGFTHTDGDWKPDF